MTEQEQTQNLISYYKYVIDRSEYILSIHKEVKKSHPHLTKKQQKIKALAQAFGYTKCASSTTGWRKGRAWISEYELLKEFPNIKELKLIKLCLIDMQKKLRTS